MGDQGARADLNFAMNPDGTANQSVLDSWYGDSWTPIASSNGIHVMGLADYGTGVIIRWYQNFAAQGGQHLQFHLKYNNDAVGGGPHAGLSYYGHPWTLGGTKNTQAAGKIADGQGSGWSSPVGPRQSYLYMPSYLGKQDTTGDGNIDYVREITALYPTGPAAIAAGMQGNSMTVPKVIAYTHTGYSPQTSTHGMWNSSGFSGYAIWEDYNTGKDVDNYGNTLEAVVNGINDPGFNYEIWPEGKAVWDGPWNSLFLNSPMVSFSPSLLHVPPMQLVYPVAGLTVSDNIMVYKNGKLILPASYTVASEELTFTEEGVTTGDLLTVIKVK